MKKETKHIADLIKNQMLKIVPDAEVILYGSRAQGNEHAESDWDILILTKNALDIKKEREVRNHLYDLELEIGEAFSVFIFSKENWENKQKATPFYHNIKKTGILI